MTLFLIFYFMIGTLGGVLLVYNLNTRRGPERSDAVHWVRMGLLFVPIVQGLILGQQLSYLTTWPQRS